MTGAQFGDTVKIYCTVKLKNGEVVDSSLDRKHLEFTIGKDEIVPGLEEAVIGMKPGEAKESYVHPKQAFGQRREELVMDVERERLPDEVEPEAGQLLEMRTKDDQNILVMIADMNEDSVRLDANHPLAGEELVFNIELLDIVH